MAPPMALTPVSALPTTIQTTTKNYKPTRRKASNFDLEKCRLFELVQYSCTTPEQQMAAARSNGMGKGMQCHPFVRLFRRCGKGERSFTVETTAWEGAHAYVGPEGGERVGDVGGGNGEGGRTDGEGQKKLEANGKGGDFANYGAYFWSKN